MVVALTITMRVCSRQVNDRPLEEYIFPSDGSGWRWDRGRWGEQGKVAEVVEALTKVGLALNINHDDPIRM